MPKSPSSPPIDWLQLDLLDFDPSNPRLREAEVSEDADQLQIGQALWQQLDAEEIVMSILAAGRFFEHDPLMVEPASKGRFTVIEGNRRLLAVKAIVDAKFRSSVGADGFEGIDKAPKALRDSLQTLPCIITTRSALWQFIGFKHVNGAKSWSAISKAEFVAKLHEGEEKIGLSEIARQIGDRHDTVKRLYQGWCVLRQAEEARVFLSRNREATRFSFSHLYTIIEYPNAREFLGMSKEPDYENRRPVHKSHMTELGELCLWLYGRKEPQPAIKPIIRSQNPDLSDLETALGREAGKSALRAAQSLQVARDASLGNKRLFDGAMDRAVVDLKNANAVCAVGAEGNRAELSKAEEAYNLAGAILSEVERKNSGEKRRGSRAISK